MMADRTKLSVKDLGLHGVNVDKDPFELEDGELRHAHNAIHEGLGANAGIKNRPGLAFFNLDSGPGAILGGIAVPTLAGGASLNSGTRYIYIGRSADA